MKSDKITIGILAHVDAGKTTLSEGIFYETGLIDKIGRVDHKDAYLDTYELEKNRGITIYAKQAVFSLNDYIVSLLDTPGHVDFSAEMERTLRVLDYAILVISGTDGVQGHTSTVWKLLKNYHVPTFIFVNKMDLAGADSNKIITELQHRLDENCIDFSNTKASDRLDDLAVCEELLMEAYLATGSISDTLTRQAISRRHVYPVYFGSALKHTGIKELLKGFGHYIQPKSYPEIFGARVFKVVRDQGERLTYLKITGGTLKVKHLLTNRFQRNLELTEDEKQEIWEEKVDQIRVYSGDGYEMVKEAGPGSICAVTGLTRTSSGDGLGFENKGDRPELIPVLSYKVNFPKGTNVYGMLKNLRLLEEEEPHLNVLWNESIGEVHLQVMGEIQIEILKTTILERFGVEVAFEKGSLVYRETIKKPVVGVGHFEPLKHYAEVHLLMEPLPQGSGLEFDSNCSEDVMDRNWQRLVVSHLKERRHPGVLTGSNITDMKITLVAGRGHNKHTEGGDFRQATFRALRQGLMKSENVLMEPIYDFRLELPKEMLGRGMADVERLNGRCEDPVIEGDQALLRGSAPVSSMMHYGKEVVAYSKGQGRLELILNGYEPCHNQKEIVEAYGYDPETDSDNPTGSVFCSKGVGYGVPWHEADSHMHVDSGIRLNSKDTSNAVSRQASAPRHRGSYSDAELEAVFTKTYGERKERIPGGGSRLFHQDRQEESPNIHKTKNRQQKGNNQEVLDKYLLVDGYNIIFAWEELQELAERSLDLARTRLMDILSNYQGHTGETVILVFDAYRVAGNKGTMTDYHNIHVVYTKEAETADQYIERMVHTIRPKHEVTVATSDVVEQVIILGKGANRLSAENFRLEIAHVDKTNKEHFIQKGVSNRNRPIERALKDKKIQ